MSAHRYLYACRAGGYGVRKGSTGRLLALYEFLGGDHGRLDVLGVDAVYVERRVHTPDKFGLDGCRLRVLRPGQAQVRVHPRGPRLILRDQDNSIGPDRPIALGHKKPGQCTAKSRAARTPQMVAQDPAPQAGWPSEIQQP